jgi:RNA polymerase sigma-70 factor (ECF subfamily)
MLNLNPHEEQVKGLIALYPRLRRAMTIFMFGSRIDADDVVQDAYEKAFERIHSFREDSSLYTWLYQIARNRALDLVRKKAPDLMDEEGWMDRLMDDRNDDPGESGQVQALRQAIRQLPSTMREVVVLKVLEGFSYEEMEQITGENVQTLKSRMFRAKRRLHELMKPDT